MVIYKEGNLFIVKVYKENIHDFDIYDIDKISVLFKDIIIKLKRKYKIRGLCDIDVYVNDKFGMIIEVNNIYKYGDDLDIKISFHIDCCFMMEINFEIEDMDLHDQIYYYKNKFYSLCNGYSDSDVIYKDVNDIIKKGIRIK